MLQEDITPFWNYNKRNQLRGLTKLKIVFIERFFVCLFLIFFSSRGIFTNKINESLRVKTGIHTRYLPRIPDESLDERLHALAQCVPAFRKSFKQIEAATVSVHAHKERIVNFDKMQLKKKQTNIKFKISQAVSYH